ncbi:MAG: hypothetical protein ACE5GL_08895, partial [Calditrichia bacterium]
MIEPSKFKDPDLLQNLHELEMRYIDEIEEMIISRLFSVGQLSFGEADDEILEFSGKTNYKIQLKRPNKNVWSIPIQLLKEAIRKVLRTGELPEAKIGKLEDRKLINSNYDIPI